MKNTSPFIILLFLFGMMSCQQNNQDIIFHKSHEPKKAQAPFSDVVEANGLLFLAGQVGMNHSTRTLVEGGIEAETKQCIENIKAVLSQHGSSLDRVVKCTVVLKDINDFAAFNEVYKTYFPNKPARTTFAASGLAVNANIEIDVIAVK
ncbi:Rid family detoxifying hydrolase [uncultured Psychroserpens sp.]|uniref:RidA family protein n=1 Tax=uncultured Psychroserpens sp. TaxID=255436 RepID=UPI00260DC759|nr:Rid family detoxifying hydrolase [uncultured Psychroserpens sp.]